MMRPRIILLHEISGVSDNLERLASLLESRGAGVSIPRLYGYDYRGTEPDESYRKFHADVGFDLARQRLRTAIERGQSRVSLPGGQSRVTLIGFSVGATVAWLESRHPLVDRVICVYGSRIRDYLDIEPTAETSLLCCEEKGFDVGVIRDAVRGRKRVSFCMIDGLHGFYSRDPWESGRVQILTQHILQLLGR